MRTVKLPASLEAAAFAGTANLLVTACAGGQALLWKRGFLIHSFATGTLPRRHCPISQTPFLPSHPRALVTIRYCHVLLAQRLPVYFLAFEAMAHVYVEVGSPVTVFSHSRLRNQMGLVWELSATRPFCDGPANDVYTSDGLVVAILSHR